MATHMLIDNFSNTVLVVLCRQPHRQRRHPEHRYSEIYLWGVFWFKDVEKCTSFVAF